MTTEHDKDRRAFEACGYAGLQYDAIADLWWCEQYENHQDNRLAPWSSADAAIGHAERGGFVNEETCIYRCGSKWDVVVEKNEKRGGGMDTNLGLAIRDAILVWANAQEKKP